VEDEHKSFFLAAVKYFYKDHKKQGGTQQKLAKDLGVTQSYLSSILNGSRSSSLDLQIQIANRLYGPFDKFLAAGRNIIAGRSPDEEKKEKHPNDAERLLTHLTHYVVHKQQTEKQLYISEEKFRDICLMSGDMVYEMDTDLKITFVAGKVKEICGREPEEVIGHKMFEFFDADEEERAKFVIDDAVRNRTIFNLIIPDSMGSKKRYRNTIGKPIISAQSGEYIGIRGVSRDITEQIELVIERDEYEWLLESALDAINNTGVLILDKESRIMKWNLYYKELFRYPQEILDTRDLHKYLEYQNDKLVNPEYFHRDIRELMDTQGEITHYVHLKDGRTIKRKVKPIHKNGVFAGRIIFLQDVTTGETAAL